MGEKCLGGGDCGVRGGCGGGGGGGLNKGWVSKIIVLIRAQKPRNKTISCIGQSPTRFTQRQFYYRFLF